jgi:citrate/tricarballylate utilization protein
MPYADSIKEADRLMTICNACRYCEGFCAVFPAMELRRTFSAPDLRYLANLCHNCRGCYYACQYAPPHEFDVNVPRTFAEVRFECYHEFVRPRVLAGLLRRNGLWVAIITVLSVACALLLLLGLQSSTVVFGDHSGEGAFYRVIPYTLMVAVFSVLAVFVLAVVLAGTVEFLRKTGAIRGGWLDFRSILRAAADALQLKYLAGGGHGCNYPAERFSMIRRWFHHLVFYGFTLCFASTGVAAIYDHFFQRPAPYPFWSWPVVLGTVGGILLLAGTGGLLVLKTRMDPAPTIPQTSSMDVAFLTLLFFTSLTGLLLLVLRETSAMGTLLAVHLGLVFALFVSMPYGKFIHAPYRFAALVRNAVEQSRQGE